MTMAGELALRLEMELLKKRLDELEKMGAELKAQNHQLERILTASDDELKEASKLGFLERQHERRERWRQKEAG